MTTVFRYLAMAGALAVALDSSAALAQTGLDSAKVPPVPTDIQVPAGNTLFLKGRAQGTQSYICLPATSGFDWKFVAPQATLFFDLKLGSIDFHQQIITHFLSPNPDEASTPRATWQGSIDTSAVWAKAVVISSDPAFVAPGAIPWLRLEAVGTERGPNGGDLLAHTTFVQRLNTAGGIAPVAGCSSVGNVGATALVPYTADYFFYKATKTQ
ncbi:DUF3455 domain-containing protein [uncultured Paludibaculum sp.]|uniref:DUF3455 domain-containing protein n=1 Tax=uncultured Paludibaculum sp. TaxID=1765020 RepID=UPI002AAB5936|nr:DUF3455 domain-containing protein [uncultured Paludibaculum sp.]